jgi:hypothetical protein
MPYHFFYFLRLKINHMVWCGKYAFILEHGAHEQFCFIILLIKMLFRTRKNYKIQLFIFYNLFLKLFLFF